MTGVAAVSSSGAGTKAAGRSGSPYRVMVVDDSAVIRGLLSRALEADPDIAVVASVGNGQMALNTVARQDIEIVILDIEMPVMDGLTALPKLLAAKPGIQVIMASTLTQRGADISMGRCALGAADYVTKPGSSALTTADQFKRELLDKVKALGLRAPAVAPRGAAAPPRSASSATGRRWCPISAAPATSACARSRSRSPRWSPSARPPAGRRRCSASWRRWAAITQPVLITQHMPATFTTILAEHIQRLTDLTAAEAADGEPVKGGRIYIAPGDFHMVVEVQANQKVIRLTKAPPENFCRPAVDPMLRSLARAYGRRS